MTSAGRCEPSDSGNAAALRRGRLAHARATCSVLALIAALGAIPGAAVAQVVPDGRTQTTVSGNGSANVNVTTQTISKGAGFNSFSKFNANPGQNVNLHLPKGTGAIVNIVNGPRSQINGAVRAMQNGKVGGKLYFANPNGVVVGPSGSFQAGSVSVSTPSQGFVDGFFDKNGRPRAGAAGQLFDGTEPLSGAAIEVDGRILATDRVRLRAGGDLSISGTVS
ncbi:MAG: leukotoxin LktA family filamentous adhesin, partial [Rhodobiaceae bacterium]|nr:leukotoxin LktA family filamentous adhesin [Rhodobiaceae bacterium]